MDNNILIKITGESDLSDAQLQLRELSERGKELEQEMRKLQKAEQDDIQACKERIAAGKEDVSELQKTIKYNKELQKAKQQEIAANQKSIQTLKQSVSAYNAMTGAGNKMTQQVRAIREQLAQMEMAGDTSSAAFIELSVQAARLSDQMGDTQKRIRVLASDTQALDAAMNLGSGVAGAFNVATSAAALLGNESEELQQAFLKVQAAMAILNGVQQVANVLNKDSAAMITLNTLAKKAYEKITRKNTTAIAANAAASSADAAASTADAAAKGVQTTATGAATAAQWSFNAAMYANPIGVIVAAIVAFIAVIGGLIMAFKSFFSAEAKAEKMAEIATNTYEQQQDRIKRATSKTEEAIKQKVAAREKMHAQEIADAIQAGKTQEEIAQMERDAEIDMLRYEQSFYEERKTNMQNDLNATNEYIDGLVEAYKKEGLIYTDANGNIIYSIKKDKKGKEDEEQREKINKLLDAYDKRRTINTSMAEADKEYAETNKKINAAVRADEQATRDEIYKVRSARLASQKKIADLLAQTARAGRRMTFEEHQTADREDFEREQKYQEDLLKLQLKNQQIKRDEYNRSMQELAAQRKLYDANELVKAQQHQEDLLMAELEHKKRMADEYAKASALRAEKDPFTGDITFAEQQRLLNNDFQRAYQASMAKLNLQLQQGKISQEQYDQQMDELMASQETHLAQMQANEEKHYRDMQALSLQYAPVRAAKQAYEQGMAEIDALQEQGLLSHEEYEKAKYNITRDYAAAQLDEVSQLYDNITSFATQAFSTIADIAQSSIQAQMDALEQMYTTDADEAAKDANKKYITEKELEEKKKALQMKSARIKKAQAIFEIGLAIPQAIMKAIADFGPPPSPMGIAAIAMASALGAAQLAAAMAKPLNQYAKGRKGGAGEYALVGERGAEIMYIPQGASIIPHDKITHPDTWGTYGVPQPYIPIMPHIDTDIAGAALLQQMGFTIDYERLGKAVADNVHIPAQKAVHVNIDRSGLTIQDNGDTHIILNRKYEAAWT